MGWDIIFTGMFYFVKTPAAIRALHKERTWTMPVTGKEVYLTFDDGPHPSITPFVLDLLQQYKAKATFFCVGGNVRKYPQVYEKILAQGHSTGNHTYRHLNGWQSHTGPYISDIAFALRYIASHLFRPPYGKITPFQSKLLRERGIDNIKFKIIMWDVLSGDFDERLNADACISNVTKNTKPGSIVVFHDSDKAWPRLEKALPAVLENLSERGFVFKSIQA